MPVTRDIAATYRGPSAVIRRILARGPSEPRALAFLMGACAVTFIAQWPRLARQAHLESIELNPLLGASLMAWLFIAPLLFYTIALISHWIARAVGGKGSAFGSRLALFWALLATTPLILLNGLVAGFIGEGPELQFVGAVWFGAFMWFWLRGLKTAHAGEAA